MFIQFSKPTAWKKHLNFSVYLAKLWSWKISFLSRQSLLYKLFCELNSSASKQSRSEIPKMLFGQKKNKTQLPRDAVTCYCYIVFVCAYTRSRLPIKRIFFLPRTQTVYVKRFRGMRQKATLPSPLFPPSQSLCLSLIFP